VALLTVDDEDRAGGFTRPISVWIDRDGDEGIGCRGLGVTRFLVRGSFRYKRSYTDNVLVAVGVALDLVSLRLSSCRTRRTSPGGT
jgi:hypothetical protein